MKKNNGGIKSVELHLPPLQKYLPNQFVSHFHKHIAQYETWLGNVLCKACIVCIQIQWSIYLLLIKQVRGTLYLFYTLYTHTKQTSLRKKELESYHCHIISWIWDISNKWPIHVHSNMILSFCMHLHPDCYFYIRETDKVGALTFFFTRT